MVKKSNGAKNEMEKENLKRKQRSDDEFEDDSEEAGEEATDMTSFLQRFTTDLKKRSSAKKKKIAGLAASSSKTAKVKLDSMFEEQCKVREALTKEYKKQFEAVIAQWEIDINKSKEAEEKVAEAVAQQQKLMAQVRLVQTQRLKATKNLHTQYVESVEEAENNVKKQQEDLAVEIRKEMAEFQKKIMADSQAQDMANMKKVLRTVMQ